MSEQKPPVALKPKDYASDQEVRWCPGCGDYAILKGMQMMLAEIAAPKEKTVFISGIGCAARFPYYMDTYGFHTIHGRAGAVATGVKLANPELDIWVVGGDGDSLSIGGNHLLHLLRRNPDLQYLLFNNEIYGLTKGQYSPTSRTGSRTPSSPWGSVEHPLNAVVFALGAGARFVARAGDVQIKHLVGVLKRARAHKGTGFVEIIQNCIVYNDGVFGHFMDKAVAADAQILVEHGQPLTFGKEGEKALHFNPQRMALEVIRPGEDGHGEDDVLIHDQTNPVLAGLLAGMEAPEFPVAMGVIYDNPAPTYDAEITAAMTQATATPGDFDALLRSGHTWTVEE